MAVNWKKVLTEGSTVTVPNGGTGQSTLTDGAVLIGDGADAIDAVPLGNDEILIGTGGTGNPVARSANANSDVKILDDGATYGATIQAGVVEGSMVADDTLDWVTHESTGTPFTVPYYAYNTGAATVTSAPSSDGDVLTYDTSTNTLKWEAAGTASSLNINDQTNADNTVGFLGFATATSGGTDFKIDQGLKYNTDPGSDNGESTLSINGGVSTADNSIGVFISAAAGVAGSFVKAVTFAGTAHNARGAQLTGGALSNTTYQLPLIDSADHTEGFSVGRRFYNNEFVTVSVDGTGDATLNIPNLNVTGTTTTVNTTTLEIEDHSVKISVPDVAGSELLNDTTAVGQGEVGILVGYNSNADENMPRIVYKGYQDSVSVLGWRVAQGANNDASSSAPAYGVGVMHVDTGTLSTSGGANALSIGVGAMAFDTDGDLWIQTEV